MLNCSDESHDSTAARTELDFQSAQLETVPLKKSFDFFNELNNEQINKKAVDVNIDLKIDLSSLEQVAITDTDAKLNIATATTGLEGVETQILQIKINGEVQTVLFHRIPENRKASVTARAPDDNAEFTGRIYSTNLRGEVLSGFKFEKGIVTNVNIPSAYIKDPVPLKEVVVKNTYIAPVTNDAYTRMNYQFVRTQNNGSAMGIAYAAYYSRLNIKNFDDGINDSQLAPCLQKILDDLKKTGASPGNMITNFTNDPWNSTRFNWTVKSGTIKGVQSTTGQTLASYNLATGVTTTFNSDAWPNATDLSWARTMLHESIHAYLVVYYNVNEPSWKATYPEMLKDWEIRGLNIAHHEEIAKTLVVQVGNALEAYGLSKGYKLDKQFYQDMAWGGLHETNAFKALSKSDQKRISNTVTVELKGTDVDGDVKSQKGKKTGC
ncbi:hypothetical protein [Flavobacterium sp. ENC]|uniref:hypothetical protein n=1 Tax=Flavobacterium sp. ENC TaxID=2897330 RepID=UPI001E3C365E|nr:hypothetical protein [Flavobacterium sp. ENC]